MYYHKGEDGKMKRELQSAEMLKERPQLTTQFILNATDAEYLTAISGTNFYGMDEYEAQTWENGYIEVDLHKEARVANRGRTELTAGEEAFLFAVLSSDCGIYSERVYNELKNRKSKEQKRKVVMNDLLVLYQDRFQWKQGSSKDMILQIHLPLNVPYNAYRTDMLSATFHEMEGTRIFGKSEREFESWVEIDTRDPVLFFSCETLKGWTTYLYHGGQILMIGNEKFAGFGFITDSVIYSLDDFPEHLVGSRIYPVVQPKRMKFPIITQSAHMRVICKTLDGDNVLLETLNVGQPGYNVRDCGLLEAQEIYRKADSVYYPRVLEVDVQVATEELVFTEIIPLPRIILKGQVRIDLEQTSAQIGILQSTQTRVEQVKASLLVEYSRHQKNLLRRTIGEQQISYFTLLTIEDGDVLISAENLQLPFGKLGPILFASIGVDPLYGLRGAGQLMHQMLMPMRKQNDEWVSCVLPWKIQIREGTNVKRELEGTLRLRIHVLRVALQSVKFLCEANVLVSYQNLYVRLFNGNGRYEQLRIGFLK
jgi:hypothetical protein